MPRSSAWARISVPDDTLKDVLGRLPDNAECVALPGLGSAHWFDAEHADSVRDVREAAEAASGSLVLIDAPVELKHEVQPILHESLQSADPTARLLPLLRRGP